MWIVIGVFICVIFFLFCSFYFYYVFMRRRGYLYTMRPNWAYMPASRFVHKGLELAIKFESEALFGSVTHCALQNTFSIRPIVVPNQAAILL